MTTISVIIPTHSPHQGRLLKTMGGLRNQSLSENSWELILVDNCSPVPVCLDEVGIVNFRIVRENRLGLTFARLAGVAAAKGDIVLFVDDDNVLFPSYLEQTLGAFGKNPNLGAVGGKSIPEWEVHPESWVMEFSGNLALRDLGSEELISGPGMANGYPICSPIGAGMALRKSAWQAYSSKLDIENISITDRHGNSLASGGDCDIVMHILEAGWQVAYLPSLILKHLIPAGRIDPEYLARLNHGIAKSWVGVLDRHGMRPWKPVSAWSLPFRKARAWFANRAWKGPVERIRWKGACGQFEGRAALADNK